VVDDVVLSIHSVNPRATPAAIDMYVCMNGDKTGKRVCLKTLKDIRAWVLVLFLSEVKAGGGSEDETIGITSSPISIFNTGGNGGGGGGSSGMTGGWVCWDNGVESIHEG